MKEKTQKIIEEFLDWLADQEYIQQDQKVLIYMNYLEYINNIIPKPEKKRNYKKMGIFTEMEIKEMEKIRDEAKQNGK